MEEIKSFFGLSNTDSAARARCRAYLQEAVTYGSTLDPKPAFIATVEEYLALTPDTTPASSTDEFWAKWDEYKEDALNLLTTKDENKGILPEGNFVAMWRYLENGRLPGSTAPPEHHERRRSSMARVRLA